MSFISYAQNYEDVMLFRALRGVEHGFYIDVGAQDPVEDSVTRAFYERGWHGINIEPMDHWYRRLVEDRPHDINLRVAVSDQSGEIEIYEVDDTGLSTSDANFAVRHRESGLSVRSAVRVPCVTLSRICAEQQVGTVHFLKVDCEGAEAAALRGMQWDRVRPWIVLVEAFEPNSRVSSHAAWEPLLLEHQYQFVYADGLNRYYVAREHANLEEAFAVPPNVFDEFHRVSEHRAHGAVTKLSVELRRAHDIEVALAAERDFLRGENERREAALKSFRASTAALNAEIAIRDGEVASSRAQIAQLRADVTEHGAELARIAQELRLRTVEREHLRRELDCVYASRSWRITAPLRRFRRLLGSFRRSGRHGIYALLRPPAHRAKPLLRWLAGKHFARRLVVRALGSDSRILMHARLFVFGVPGSAPSSTPVLFPKASASPTSLIKALQSGEFSACERSVAEALRHALASDPKAR